MSFGKQPLPQAVRDGASEEFGIYGARRLNQQMRSVKGTMLPCGCVIENRWSKKVVSNCAMHKDEPPPL